MMTTNEAAKPTLGGKFLLFTEAGLSMGRPKFSVISRRGGFYMGHVEYRNQWQAWAFHPHQEGVLNRDCLAELYAFMKSQKSPTPKRWHIGVEHSEHGPTLVVRLPFWRRPKPKGESK